MFKHEKVLHKKKLAKLIRLFLLRGKNIVRTTVEVKGRVIAKSVMRK